MASQCDFLFFYFFYFFTKKKKDVERIMKELKFIKKGNFDW